MCLVIQFFNLYISLFCLVLHRQACHVDHHDRASVVRPLRRRQLGREQGLLVHHPHLQRIHHSCPLRSLPLLLRDQVSHKVSKTCLYFLLYANNCSKELTKDENICLYKLILRVMQYSCNFIRVFSVCTVIYIFNFGMCLLLNSQGTPSAIRPSPEVLHHQIGHLPIVLARYSKWSIQVYFVEISQIVQNLQYIQSSKK